MNLLNPSKSRLQPRLGMAHRCARRGMGGIVLVACLLGGVPPAALASPAVLVIEQGTVSIKRDGWFRRFHRTRNGTHLGDTDLIRPTQNARASLRCPDETSLTPIPAGTTSSVNSLCNNTRVRYRPQDLAIGDLQGGSDPTLPYVITPRTGALFNPQPMIRWNSVPSATHYTVSLQSNQRRDRPDLAEVIWQIETDQTQVEYPGDPPLQPGRFYSIVVETDTGRSSADEGVSGLTFTFKPDAAMQAQIAAVDSLGLPVEAAVAEKVRLYTEAALTADAIMTLQDLLDQGMVSAHSYRLLGDLYLASGLRLPAETAYLKALEVVQLYQDLEDWMLTQIALGTLYARLQDTEAAIQRYRLAAVSAHYFCDVERIRKIAQKLAELTEDEPAELDVAQDEDPSCPSAVSTIDPRYPGHA